VLVEVLEHRVQRVAGALEGREARADDGPEQHPVSRLAVVDRVRDREKHQQLPCLLDRSDADERPDSSGSR
jgi:hypothetical protein